MKHNVDLTESRDFRPKHIGMHPRIKKIIGITFPWDESRLYRVDLASDSLIVTGNRIARSNFRFECEVDSSCQRCGKRMYSRPWTFELCLCKNCEDWLDDDAREDKDLVLTRFRRRGW